MVAKQKEVQKKVVFQLVSDPVELYEDHDQACRKPQRKEKERKERKERKGKRERERVKALQASVCS